MKCSRPSCDRDATTDGHCESDYRRRIRKGLVGYTDSAPSIEHIEKLRALGWPFEAIGEAARISFWVPAALMRHRYKRVRMTTEKAILAVPLTREGSKRGQDVTGLRRRVQALSWMGWPAAEVARRAGIKYETMATQMSRGRCSYASAMKVAAVYKQLSHVDGPSDSSRRKARQLGFQPPVAWDYTDIDDPASRPFGGFCTKEEAA